MKWRKIKQVFCPENNHSWMVSHASNPTARKLEGNIYRIYFSSRDTENRGYITYVDVDFNNDFKVVNVADKPLVELGKIGTFDDNGMSIGCLLEHNNKRYIYYLGWNLGANVPFRNSIGAIWSDSDKEEYERVSEGPLIDRNFHDPYSVSYPFIIQEDGAFRMWYGSHKQWGKTTDDMIHGLKHATSNDGLHWNKTDEYCIETTPEHYAFSRPFLWKEDELYKLCYSFRGKKYRIGYAESTDGINWNRKDDEVGITVSEEGWDSEMVCYPWIVEHEGKQFLLYNGNGYGKTGFGVAVRE